MAIDKSVDYKTGLKAGLNLYIAIDVADNLQSVHVLIIV